MKLSPKTLLKSTLILTVSMAFALNAHAQIQQNAPAKFVQNQVSPQTNKQQVYDVVEQMPQYPGGEQALLMYICQNVKYPIDAQEKGIQGTVLIRFVVDKQGNVTNAEVLRSLCPSADQEALRVVKSLAKWIPGEQKGEKVSVWYTLPIKFKLDGAPTKPQPVVVKEKQLFLLDGKRLPVGFDLNSLKREDCDIEMRLPETEAIRANLIARYGKDAANGVVSLTSKNPIKTQQLLEDFNKSKLESRNDKVLGVADHMPLYPGGDQALFNFISQNLKYPVAAQEKGMQGTVAVRFVVNKEGNVDQSEVLRGVDPSLDQEALRVVNLLKGWIPGKQKGQNVSVWFTLPIRFNLDSGKGSETLQLGAPVDDKAPLCIVDGKVVSVEVANKLKENDVETVKVLKDPASLKPFGDKGKNGVIVIKLKKQK